jgi:hypothetical protein
MEGRTAWERPTPRPGGRFAYPVPRAAAFVGRVERHLDETRCAAGSGDITAVICATRESPRVEAVQGRCVRPLSKPSRRCRSPHRRPAARRRPAYFCIGIVEIGRELVAVKARVPHGRYTAFVTERLGWPERAARNFVSVLEMFKATNFAGLETLTIDASSLYCEISGRSYGVCPG